ncbi:MAG: WYL domain-containing protein [Lachnospiraceae bacterium]|nr:WYL domain-containing protein [Lachnospiraceae bacterium]
MKYKNQKLKLLYLAKILQEKTDDEHGFTLPQIQEELAKYDIEANRKTLYADIAALNEYGIEIIKNQEGYKTFYHYGKREFEPAELRLIIDAIASSKFITIRKSKQLIKKLEKMVSIHEAKLLNREVIVSDRVKNMNESIFYTVDAIQYAISNNHRIKFRYYSWNMKGEMEFHHDGEFYDVSPWALCWDSENYYMVGYDTNIDEIRHYRVDKMMNTEEIMERRRGSDAFKEKGIVAYTKKHFRMVGGTEERVTLLCQKEMANVIIDQFGKETKMQKANDEKFRVKVDVVVSDQFIGWVIALGGKVVIEGPDSVRERAKALMRENLERYEI